MKTRINGEVKEIPTTWSQVSFRKFVRLADAKDDMIKIISVFTGIDEETIRTAEIKNFDLLVTMLGFMKVEIKMNLPYTILGLKVPQNIESEAAARYGDIQEIIAKFKEGDDVSNLSNYPLIVATYLAPSPYNFQEAEQIAERLWDAPCGEVMAVGNFTVMRFLPSKINAWRVFPKLAILMHKLKLVLTVYKARLAFLVRLFTWKKKHRISGTNS